MPTKRKKKGLTAKVTLSAKKKTAIAKAAGRAVTTAVRSALSGIGGTKRKSTRRKK